MPAALTRSMFQAEDALNAPGESEMASLDRLLRGPPFLSSSRGLAKSGAWQREDRPAPWCRAMPSTAVGAVVAGQVDLAVAVGSPEPPTDELERRPLLVDDIVLVQAGAQEQVVPLRALNELTVLWQAPGSGVRATAIRALEDAGLWPRETVELGSTLGVLAAVAAGYGAGLLPRRYVQPWIAMGAVTAATLDASDLYARFELISAPFGHLAPGPRALYDALQRPIEATAEAGI